MELVAGLAAMCLQFLHGGGKGFLAARSDGAAVGIVRITPEEPAVFLTDFHRIACIPDEIGSKGILCGSTFAHFIIGGDPVLILNGDGTEIQHAKDPFS